MTYDSALLLPTDTPDRPLTYLDFRRLEEQLNRVEERLTGIEEHSVRREEVFNRVEIDQFIDERNQRIETVRKETKAEIRQVKRRIRTFEVGLNNAGVKMQQVFEEKTEEALTTANERVQKIADSFIDNLTAKTSELTRSFNELSNKLTDWRETTIQRHKAQDDRLAAQEVRVETLEAAQKRIEGKLVDLGEEATLAHIEIHDFKERIIPMTIAVMGDSKLKMPSLREVVETMQGQMLWQNRGGLGVLIAIALTILARVLGIQL